MMFKEKLSKISTKIFYIIFAVIVSVVLWVYVEITENEVQDFDVSGIEFVFLNEDLLRDRGFSKTTQIPETLTITFEASRAEMARLTTPGAVTAEVDLSSIVSTGSTVLPYRIVYPSNVNTNAVTVRGASSTRITVTVDTVLSRQILVTPSYTGGAAEGLIEGTIEVHPQFITVRGPERIVARIKYASVPIYRENLTSTYTDDLEFLLIDDNDEVLDDEVRELLDISPETIWISIPITEMKDVPLQVTPFHGTTTSDENTTISIDPPFITVDGDPVAIGNINNIPLGTIDMTTFSQTWTQTFWIPIPDHIRNVSGYTEATVHIEVLGLDIAFFSTSNLHPANIPPGHSVDIITQSLDIRLRGSKEDLDQITPMNIRVVADLADRSPGTARVRAVVHIDGINAAIDPIGEYFLIVRVTPEEE